MICPYCEIDSVRSKTVSRCPRCHGRIAWRRYHPVIATIMLPFYQLLFSILGRATGAAFLSNSFQEETAATLGTILGIIAGIIYTYLGKHPDKACD